MIERMAAYKVGEQIFSTLEGAQRAEIQMLLQSDGVDGALAIEASNILVKHREAVRSIFTNRTRKPRSTPTKSKKKNAGAVKEQPALGLSQ